MNKPRSCSMPWYDPAEPELRPHSGCDPKRSEFGLSVAFSAAGQRDQEK
jgi:hypothetical protein